MTLPGENTHPSKCADCGEPLPLQVCQSAAGYYVGTWCNNCGPYSRESGYYKTHDLATEAMRSGAFGRVVGYHPENGPLVVTKLDPKKDIAGEIARAMKRKPRRRTPP